MSDKNEIRRMRTLLQKMAEMAEHNEQTGSFESGLRNYVKRYNAIVEHLEDNDALPEELFPRLEEQTDFGQLGAEAVLLADYLSDLVEETPPPAGKGHSADLGQIIALAPFLGSQELSNLVRGHLMGQPQAAQEPSPEEAASGPDMKTIVGLAPHLDSATLADLVRSYLSQHTISDPHLLVALAPHMKSHDFSQLVRQYLPMWFGGPGVAWEGETPAMPERPVASSPAEPAAPPSPPMPPKPAEPTVQENRENFANNTPPGSPEELR